MVNYPPLDEDFIFTLRLLKSAISDDSEYGQCSYSPDDKELIRQCFIERRTSNFTKLNQVEKTVWLEQEAADLYDELKNLETDFRKLEVNERIQSIKTRQILLEKLTSIQERGVNMQDMLNFQEEVLTLLETVLDETQLPAFLEKLKGYGHE